MSNFKSELNNYQSIPRKLIFDNTMSDRARFVYCFMASKPDSWEFYLTPMSKEIGYSVDTLRKYIAELVEHGWLEKGEQDKKEGNLFGAVSYTLKAEPTKTSDTEKIRHGEIPTQKDIDNNRKEIDKKEDTIVSEKEVTWRDDFNIYLSMVKEAKLRLLDDDTFCEQMERYRPNADYDKTIEKMVELFWGTEAGWHNKKSKRSQSINMYATLKNSFEKNIVYKERGQVGRVRIPQTNTEDKVSNNNNKWQTI